MSKPAARVGDMHTCPMVTPGVPPVPHLGGPILPPGVPTVLIGGIPAATLTSQCICMGPPDVIVKGSFSVLIGGKPAARMGDTTAHGGTILIGCLTVLIGDLSGAALITAINAVLNEINAGGGTENCGNIIDGVLDFLQNDRINTVSVETDGTWEEIDARMGTNLDWDNPTTFADIYNDLTNRGPGSIELIGIDYNDANENSHVVIAANINGTVGIMEGQGGTGFVTDPTEAENLYGNGGSSDVVSDTIQ